jgi:hypothetical protein
MPIKQYIQCQRCAFVMSNAVLDMLGQGPFESVAIEGCGIWCPRCEARTEIPHTEITNSEAEDGVRISQRPGDAVSWVERFGELKKAVAGAKSIEDVKELEELPEFEWAKPVLKRVWDLLEKYLPENRHAHMLVIVAVLTLLLNQCSKDEGGKPITIHDNDIIGIINNTTVNNFAAAPPQIDVGNQFHTGERAKQAQNGAQRDRGYYFKDRKRRRR